MTVKLGKSSRALMRRSLRLLDMEYKPSEIAAELSTDNRHILRLVEAGAPARKDEKGRFWIHGRNFALWLENVAPKNDKELKARHEVKDNEAYCVVCRKFVIYKEHLQRGRISYGTCPEGHKTARFFSKKSNIKGKVKNHE
jgi:hypothetical protein